MHKVHSAVLAATALIGLSAMPASAALIVSTGNTTT